MYSEAILQLRCPPLALEHTLAYHCVLTKLEIVNKDAPNTYLTIALQAHEWRLLVSFRPSASASGYYIDMLSIAAQHHCLKRAQGTYLLAHGTVVGELERARGLST